MEVPDELVVAIEATMLPAGWNRKDGEPLIARSIGDRWLANQVSAGLQVPSSVIPQEYNVLLNPAHPEFTQFTYGDPLNFPFDPRIKE